MKLEVFTVHDSAVGAFLPPFFARSRGEAIRMFQQSVQDEKSQFRAHPSDYSLYYVGSWNDENGLMYPLDVPDRVNGALDFVRSE